MGAQAFVPRSMDPRASEAPTVPRTRGAEAGALLLFAAALFLVLALLSLEFDPHDPSRHGGDWMGAVGALLGGVLVQGFGGGAWLVPIELVCLGLPLFRGSFPEQLSLRLAGDLVLLILVASLLQVLAPDMLVFGLGLPGGNVGLFFGELLRGLFSGPGSVLVAATSIGLILIGRASFSFIELCERLVLHYRRLTRFSLDAGRRGIAAWREARALRIEQARLLDPELEPGELEEEPSNAFFAAAREEWVPGEATGHPPLAIVESLRRGFEVDRALDEPGFGLEEFLTGLTETESDAGGGAPVRGASVRGGASTARGVASFARSDAASTGTLAETESSLGEGAAWEEDGFWSGLVEEDARGAAGESAPPSDVAEDESELEEDENELEASADEAGADEASSDEPRIVDTKPQQETRAARRDVRARRAGAFVLPSTELLDHPSGREKGVSREVLLGRAAQLEKTLLDYGVVGQVEEIHPGPTVTTFEFSPHAGTKVSKVAGLADDLALGLSRKVRIIAPIPGKNRIGFELPNDDRQPVNLRELVEDERFQNLAQKAPLPVVLGRDIVGAPFYADLAAMPHVIVAGATGAGKSVGLNIMLSSLLFQRTPEELRLLMIDPKVVELAPFDRIPHLLLPVVTDMKQAATALRWAVDEMERRYQMFAEAGTKNITTYNRFCERVAAGEIPAPLPKMVEAIGPSGETVLVPAVKKGSEGAELPEKLPFIVIVVDEFADLMMQQGKEVEASVARLAQKARAAGMHVILATQRPSVDVITGMIKANFPSRIAFRVAQKVDSRTILDEQGAEVLLGRGDMLVKLNGSTDTLRVQCPFVSEEEVEALTAYLRTQGEPRYQESILEEAEDEGDEPEADDKTDNRFEEAVLIVRETQRCSTSWLQRKMTIGYNRAAKIVEMMERRGYVGPPNGSRDREVLIPPG